MRIVIFGGTAEGRLLAESFRGTELELHICVATEYGASLLPKRENIVVHMGRMQEEEMEDFLAEISPSYCLDATHPYAARVTENIRRACEIQKISYIRIYRKKEDASEFVSVRKEEGTSEFVSVGNVEEAAGFLQDTTGNILITTGSKELEKYKVIPEYTRRCFARVLPTVSVLEKCAELGFEGRNLIAMQGPFNEEMNYALMKQCDIKWMVTKNSGKEGGYQEKCEAALRAGVNILVVERPKECLAGGKDIGEPGTDEETAEKTAAQEKVMNLPRAISFLKQLLPASEAEKRKVYLISMGPGNPELLTEEARKCIQKSQVLIGAQRMLDISRAAVKEAGEKPVFKSYLKEEIAAFLREHTEYLQAAVLYSGDVGFYSGARGMKELLTDFQIQEVSGISSPVYFLNKLGIPWDETLLASCHGKQINLIPLIKTHKRVCVLLGERDRIARVSRSLLAFHMDKVKITVGERLSYPEERIISGTAADMVSGEFDSLSVALFENDAAEDGRIAARIRDEAFIRGKVPMTKEEIRTLSLSKLGLWENAVLYDIGAGTGSVSIEASLWCPSGQVYAIEKKPEAAALIKENKIRFQAENLEIIEGTAPECLKELKEPDCVFIGGSSGRLIPIIREVRKKNPSARFVVNAVTLETMSEISRIKEEFPEYREMEVIQVNVARSRSLAGYQLMNAENPVMIASFGPVSGYLKR